MHIAVADVSFAYPTKTVIHDVSLAVEPGEVVALLGPNGAGKTTLIELILGFLKPTQGEVSTLGANPLRSGDELWVNTGVVQQQWRDHPKWKVRDQLAWVATAYQSAGAEVKGPEEAAREVGLLDHIDHPLGKLSGGQRRRIDFATATIHSPRLLVLDEPTTGLDPQARADIHELVDVANLSGTTVLMTTHDLAEAEKVASRILILKEGRIIADGTSNELRADLGSTSQIRWTDGAGITQVHSTDRPLEFLRTLPGDTTDLTVSRHTLEDAYLKMIGEEQ